MRFENFLDISLFHIWESFSAILRHELQLVTGVAYIYNDYSYTVPFQAFTDSNKDLLTCGNCNRSSVL